MCHGEGVDGSFFMRNRQVMNKKIGKRGTSHIGKESSCGAVKNLPNCQIEKSNQIFMLANEKKI